MATTGQVFPGTVATVSETPWSDNNWTSASNVTADDTSYASITTSQYDSPDQSYVLKASNFDFSAIPAGSTIDGVIVRARAWRSAGTGSIDLVQLLNTSLAKVGTNQAATPTALTGSQADYTFGTSTDKWGNTLTLAWIQNANFGVAYGNAATSSNADVFCDWITIEVYYTAPTPTSTAVAEISLASHGTPSEYTNHSIKVRARTTTGSTGTIRAALYEGASNRSGDLASTVLTNTLANYTLAISDASAATITDYSNLSIRLWGYDVNGGALVFEVAELSLELPTSTAAASLNMDLFDRRTPRRRMIQRL